MSTRASMRFLALVAFALVVGCTTAKTSGGGTTPEEEQAPALAEDQGPTGAAESADEDEVDAQPLPDGSGEPAGESAPESVELSVDTALELLFLADEDAKTSAVTACGDAGDVDNIDIACLIGVRYAADPKAAKLAQELYTAQGTVAGVEVAYTDKVGWRGVIEFVPELPIKKHREHLGWVVAGMTEIGELLDHLDAQSPVPVAYRIDHLSLRFFRSVDRTTPSAYAHGWTVAYNVDGSLLRSKRRVRETLFHELFHLNDFDHDRWSDRALLTIYDELMSRCAQEGKDHPSTKCLAPYAPSKTKVKGGTFYAFTPGNGVHEYAAELALRYYLEQRAAWLGKKGPEPFKCGPKENAEAWSALVDEFFAGVDLIPECDP